VAVYAPVNFSVRNAHALLSISDPAGRRLTAILLRVFARSAALTSAHRFIDPRFDWTNRLSSIQSLSTRPIAGPPLWQVGRESGIYIDFIEIPRIS
jgi:hypothetical protein